MCPKRMLIFRSLDSAQVGVFQLLPICTQSAQMATQLCVRCKNAELRPAADCRLERTCTVSREIMAAK